MWEQDGKYFATCGHDKVVVVYNKGDGGEYSMLRKKEFVNLPEAMCFLDDSVTLVVCTRDDNYFHYVAADSGEESKVNMNPLGASLESTRANLPCSLRLREPSVCGRQSACVWWQVCGQRHLSSNSRRLHANFSTSVLPCLLQETTM